MESVAKLAEAAGGSAIKKTAHLGYLDGLRALAAIYVVQFHALIEVLPDGQTFSGAARAVSALFVFGHQAVDLFIVISGFCLLLPVLKSDGYLAGGVRTFFWKRARRILPPYFIALALTLLAIAFFVGKKTGTGWDASLPVTHKGLVAHLLLVQDVFPDTAYQINAAFWSISVEWRIYFIFPVLLIAWRKIGPIAASLAAIVTSYLLVFLLLHSPLRYNPEDTVGIMPQYLGLFALGTLGAGICYSKDASLARIRQRVPWMPLSCVTLALSLGLYKLRLFHGQHCPVVFSDLVAGICAMSLLVGISINEKSWLRDLLAWKPLAFTGTFAYSIYLIHAPVQQFIWQSAIRPLNLPPFTVFLIQSTVGVLAIVGVSYGFFLIGERPFLTKPKIPRK